MNVSNTIANGVFIGLGVCSVLVDNFMEYGRIAAYSEKTLCLVSHIKLYLAWGLYNAFNLNGIVELYMAQSLCQVDKM